MNLVMFFSKADAKKQRKEYLFPKFFIDFYFCYNILFEQF